MTSLEPILHNFVHNFIFQHRKKLFEIVNVFGDVVHILFPEIFSENVEIFQNVYNNHGLCHGIYFASKSNKSSSFLEMAASNRIGVEVSSLFELRHALNHGILGESIIISGPGKNERFLLLALHHNSTISIDSIDEINIIIELINNHFVQYAKKANILVRINDINHNISRFGISFKEMKLVYELIKVHSKMINFLGLSFHIDGYSIKDTTNGLSIIIDELYQARQNGFICDVVDIGGGFTIQYLSEKSWQAFLRQSTTQKFYRNKKIDKFYPYFSEYTKGNYLDRILNNKYYNLEKTISERLKKEGLKLIIEPGRSLLDQAGITIFQVTSVKENANSDALIMVAGNINHLSEQWYNSEFLPEPILVPQNYSCNKKRFIASVGGNTCMEDDMLTWRKIVFKQKPKKGDLLIYINTAAYQMDSNESSFNLLPIPPKIVIYKCCEGRFNWKEDKNFSILDL